MWQNKIYLKWVLDTARLQMWTAVITKLIFELETGDYRSPKIVTYIIRNATFAKPFLVEIKDSFCMLYAISLVFIYCVKYFDNFIERITLLRLRLPYESTFVLVKHLNWLVSFCIT